MYEHLVSFGSLLSAAMRYSRLQMLGEFPRPLPPGPGTAGGAAAESNVAGGFQILFDNSDEVFAVAGVVPRIMLYNYRTLLSTSGTADTGGRQTRGAAAAAAHPAPHAGPGHGPALVAELTARTKLSCLSFSPAVRQQLLASDHEGGVALWDTVAGTTVGALQA